MLLTSYGGNRVILAAERLLSSESMVPRISDRWERRVHAAGPPSWKSFTCFGLTFDRVTAASFTVAPRK